MRTTNKAIAMWKGGINYLVETAADDRGQMYERTQSKGPYGYRWGAWRLRNQHVDAANVPTMIEAGFSTLFIDRTGRAARLRLPV